MSDSKGPNCPVCLEHTEADAIASQGLLLTGMEAILNKDRDTIVAVFKALTPWDGHCAITMLLAFMGELCGIYGNNLRESIADMRQQLANAQTES